MTQLADNSSPDVLRNRVKKLLLLEDSEEYPDDQIRSINNTCAKNCDDHKFEPVCGSDKKVYDNKCRLLKKNCRKSVKLADWEECRGHFFCPAKCLEIQDPVCGEDGNIYPNICVMHSKNCGKLMVTRPLKNCFARARELRRSFQECPETCLNIYRPICGSNGVVYLNDCYLHKHTCGQKVQPVAITNCVLVRRCPQICVALYDPVCGSDGKMYLNYCRMLQQNCGKKVSKMSKTYCGGKEPQWNPLATLLSNYD